MSLVCSKFALPKKREYLPSFSDLALSPINDPGMMLAPFIGEIVSLTCFAAVVKILDVVLTKAVPTNPLSGINAYIPLPISANSSNKGLSKRYPKPKVLILHRSCSTFLM
eukprot:Lithocolla_globosa_v1_NODE_3542_length_1643_cov_10.325567.p2 type:complete len:110 gc:universal NODE_3542_length_1643_cov_10.325567:723-1052(+)